MGFSLELISDLGLNETLLSFSKDEEVIQGGNSKRPIKLKSIEVIK